MSKLNSTADETKPAETPKILLIQDYLFRRHDYRLNTVANEIERTPKGKNDWESTTEEQLTYELFVHGFKGFQAHLAALLKSDQIPKSDPLKAYFEGLAPWVEGDPDYIDQLAAHVKALDPNWFRVMFKKHLVRMVACAVEAIQFNKQCLTLVSTQNDGKTSFLRYLCPPTLSRYYTEQVDFSNKDGQISLTSNFIINIDELKGLQRQEVNQLKAFFSTATVKVRRPYDKRDSWARRKASFVASNNRKDFLTDETGNVRWLVFEIAGINHDFGGPNGYSSVPIDRVWAQAYALLKAGFPPEMTPDEIAMSEAINRTKFFSNSMEIELLQKYCEPAEANAPGAEFMTATDLHIYLTQQVPTAVKINANNLGKALAFLNYTQKDKKVNGGARKGYWVKKLEIVETTLRPYDQDIKPLKEKQLEVVGF